MRRRLLIALFAIGTVAGFGSGFAHLFWCARGRRAAFEQRVASVCAKAALDAKRPKH
jgi:hypothetical protein